MADSILEQIAVEFLSTIRGINQASGYENNVTASRRKQRYSQVEDPTGKDRHCVIYQDNPLRDTEPPQQHVGWRQPFYVLCYVTEDEDTSVSLDTRINSLRADVEKAVRANPHMSALAVDTVIDDPIMIEDEHGGIMGIAVRAVVWYRTLQDDPYTQ